MKIQSYKQKNGCNTSSTIPDKQLLWQLEKQVGGGVVIIITAAAAAITVIINDVDDDDDDISWTHVDADFKKIIKYLVSRFYNTIQVL